MKILCTKSESEVFDGSMLEFNYPQVHRIVEGTDAEERLNSELTRNWRNIRAIRAYKNFIIISRFNNKSFRSSDVTYEVHNLDSSFDTQSALDRFSSFQDARNFVEAF